MYRSRKICCSMARLSYQTGRAFKKQGERKKGGSAQSHSSSIQASRMKIRNFFQNQWGKNKIEGGILLVSVEGSSPSTGIPLGIPKITLEGFTHQQICPHKKDGANAYCMCPKEMFALVICRRRVQNVFKIRIWHMVSARCVVQYQALFWVYIPLLLFFFVFNWWCHG